MDSATFWNFLSFQESDSPAAVKLVSLDRKLLLVWNIGFILTNINVHFHTFPVLLHRCFKVSDQC